MPLAACEANRATLVGMSRRELSVWGHANGVGGREDWSGFKAWLKANLGFDWQLDAERASQAATERKRARPAASHSLTP